jgi:hypothetical protein
MVHAQSCRPIQPLCYQVLVTKQSALYQDISHRRAALWSVSRHHRVSATIPDHAARHRNNQIISRTEPEAFFLDVYFNAHPVGSPVDAKQKLKAPNALMPTVIPYAGGIVEYAVNMGSEVP